MSPHTQRRCDGPKAISETESVLSRHTVPPGQSSPRLYHYTKDWRRALDKKMQDLLYSFGASLDLKSNSNVVKMGEAYHGCVLDSQDAHNTAQIGEGYYMKAMFPGADFDASLIKEARGQRIETLESSIRGGEKPESVSQEENKNSTRKVEKSGDECLDELLLLRNHVAPRRERNQQAIKMVKSDEQPRPAAKPFTYDDMVLDSPMPDSPKPDGPNPEGPKPSKLHEELWAVLRKGSAWPDSVSGYEAGDSDTPTVTSATNAAVWRSEGKYDGSSEEQQQEEENRAGRLSTRSLGTVTDLEQWVDTHVPESPESPWRRDSGLAGLEERKTGLEETKLGFADGDGGEEAKLPEPSPKKSLSSLPDSFPLWDGRRDHRTKNHSPGQKTAQRHLEHGKPRLKSMMRGAARYTRRPTTAEKGKSPAKCECPQCRPQRYKRVRFDSSAMDKADDGPGLSYEGFVKRMSENRRRMEADPRGEGWSRRGGRG